MGIMMGRYNPPREPYNLPKEGKGSWFYRYLMERNRQLTKEALIQVKKACADRSIREALKRLRADMEKEA